MELETFRWNFWVTMLIHCGEMLPQLFYIALAASIASEEFLMTNALLLELI